MLFVFLRLIMVGATAFNFQKFLKLTDEEAVAINCHMGFADQKDMSSVSKAYETYPLAWMLHAADEMATYIDKV
mgnify:CR=1 FL=1